jgi:hypothetical protein
MYKILEIISRFLEIAFTAGAIAVLYKIYQGL